MNPKTNWYIYAFSDPTYLQEVLFQYNANLWFSYGRRKTYKSYVSVAKGEKMGSHCAQGEESGIVVKSFGSVRVGCGMLWH